MSRSLISREPQIDQPIDLRSFVLWCMSLDPLTRWHPLRTYRDHAEAEHEHDTMTAATRVYRTSLLYTVLPAGERPVPARKEMAAA